MADDVGGCFWLTVVQWSAVVVTEAPEEITETRSLYEQLQAQKDAKQLEYDEQHRLSMY